MAKKLTFEKWVKQYRPLSNHLVPDAPYDGLMFETYGNELEFVRNHMNTDPRKIWTQVEVDDKMYILSGFHYVNRFGYYVTEITHQGPDVEFRV